MVKFNIQNNNDDNTITLAWETGSITVPAIGEGEGIKIICGNDQSSKLLHKDEEGQLIISDLEEDGSIKEFAKEDEANQEISDSFEAVEHYYVNIIDGKISGRAEGYSENVEVYVENRKIQYKITTYFGNEQVGVNEFEQSIAKGGVCSLLIDEVEYIAYDCDEKIYLLEKREGKYKIIDNFNFTVKASEGVRYSVENFGNRAMFKQDEEQNRINVVELHKVVKGYDAIIFNGFIRAYNAMDPGEFMDAFAMISLEDAKPIFVPLTSKNEAIFVGKYVVHIKGSKLIVSEYKDGKIANEVKGIWEIRQVHANLAKRDIPVQIFNVRIDNSLELSKRVHNFPFYLPSYLPFYLPLTNENEAIVIGKHVVHVKGNKNAVSEYENEDEKIGDEVLDAQKIHEVYAKLKEIDYPVQVFDIQEDNSLKLSKRGHNFSFYIGTKRDGKIIIRLECKEFSKQIIEEEVIEIKEKKYITLFKNGKMLAYRDGTQITFFIINPDHSLQKIRPPKSYEMPAQEFIKIDYTFKDGYRMMKPGHMIHRITGIRRKEDVEKQMLDGQAREADQWMVDIIERPAKIEEYMKAITELWIEKDKIKYQIGEDRYVGEIACLEKKFDEVVNKIQDPNSSLKKLDDLKKEFVESLDKNDSMYLKKYVSSLKKLYEKIIELDDKLKPNVFKEINKAKEELLSAKINKFVEHIFKEESAGKFVGKLKGDAKVAKGLCSAIGKSIFEIVAQDTYDKVPSSIRQNIISGSDKDLEEMTFKVLQAFSKVSFDGDKGFKAKYLGRKNGASLFETIKECFVAIFKSIFYKDDSFDKWRNSRTEIEIIDEVKFNEFLDYTTKIDKKAANDGKSKLMEQISRIEIVKKSI